jgi:hypothetical protein
VPLPLLQAFPFPSTLGEVALHTPSLTGVFVYNSYGKWPFPPLQWSFPYTATFISFPAPGCWAGAATPAFSSRLVYFSSMSDCPSSLFSAQGAPPSLLHVFFVVVVVYSIWFFSLFSLGGGQSVQGAMLIWPRVVCGSTMCCLAHLVVCIFPSGLGAGVLWHRSPPGFSV